MLFMTLDLPDEGTRSVKMTTLSEERAILCEIQCESGARPGVYVYGLLVKCCAMSLFERS